MFGTDPSQVDEAEVVELAELDRAVVRFGELFASSTLLDLLRASLTSTGDNLRVTLDAVAELIRRADVPAQLEFAEILEAACERQDAGYRFYEDTVYDQLVEELLPQLAPVALARLLLRLPAVYLSEDGLLDCFVPALAGPLPDGQAESLVDCLEAAALDRWSDLPLWIDVVRRIDQDALPAVTRDRVGELLTMMSTVEGVREDLRYGRRLTEYVRGLDVTTPPDWFEALFTDFIRAAAGVPYPELATALRAAVGRGWADDALLALVIPLVASDPVRARVDILALHRAGGRDEHSGNQAEKGNEPRWERIVTQAASWAPPQRTALDQLAGELRAADRGALDQPDRAGRIPAHSLAE